MGLHPVFIQAFYYAIVMVLMTFCIAFLQKGFFWKYVKVRMSFGKLVLVKVRAINRDYYATGTIEEEFLIYQFNKNTKRIKIEDNKAFYRCLAVSCIDVDERKNCVITVDYSSTNGFDAIKYNDLYLRALYKPSIIDKKEKIMQILLIGIGLGVLIIAFLTWQNYATLSAIAKSGAIGKVSAGVL